MANQPITVMHVLWDLGIGGTQQVVTTLTKYLSTRNCLPIVCAFRDGCLRGEIEKAGIKVEILTTRRHRFRNFPMFLSDLFATRRVLSKLIRKHKIEIVQTHSILPVTLLFFTIVRSTGLQGLLCTFHNARFLSSRSRPVRFAFDFLYRLMGLRINKFIAVSDEVRSEMIKRIGLNPEKIITIYNGVDVQKYESSIDPVIFRNQYRFDKDALLIATVATLKTQKGHQYLIEAAKLVVTKFPYVHFLFIGDGPLRSSLKSRANSLNLSSNIHFMGNCTGIADLLKSSDFFVLPSLWEGLSMALLEAMAAAKPIVATAVSGSKIAMIPNKTGLVVNPGNYVELADAIVELISNPSKSESMGLFAQKRVIDKFSAEKQAEEHMILYHDILTQIDGEKSVGTKINET
jgi:glycosyltransferase involved in cell wall biosynthesis